MTMKFAEFYIQDPIPEMLNEKCIGVKKCKIPQVIVFSPSAIINSYFGIGSGGEHPEIGWIGQQCQ